MDPKVQMRTCPLCSRTMTAQGLGGHMWATHGVKTGEHAKLEDVNKRVVRLEDSLQARVAVLEQAVEVMKGMHRSEKLKDGKHETVLNDVKT